MTATLSPTTSPMTIDSKSEIRWAELLESAMTAPGRMGDTYSRFYNYSFGNQILLWSQGVTEPVNTYDRWKKMKRLPQKGLTKYYVMVPIPIKKTDENGEEKVAFVKFKYVKALIKLSETIGEDLPEVEIPDWSVKTALAALDIEEVDFDHNDGNTQGYSNGRKVAINPVAVYPIKTMIHEIAHIVLGHTDSMEEYKDHRGVCEFQAEAVAYLVMHELGMDDHMDPAESRAYIQNWLGGSDRPADAKIRQVFSTVEKILKAGR